MQYKNIYEIFTAITTFVLKAFYSLNSFYN